MECLSSPLGTPPSKLCEEGIGCGRWHLLSSRATLACCRFKEASSRIPLDLGSGSPVFGRPVMNHPLTYPPILIRQSERWGRSPALNSFGCRYLAVYDLAGCFSGSVKGARMPCFSRKRPNSPRIVPIRWMISTPQIGEWIPLFLACFL